MKKHFFVLVTTILCFCLAFAIPAAAQTEEQTAQTAQDTLPTAETETDEKVPEIQEPEELEKAEETQEPQESQESDVPSISESILGFLDENTAEILGTLTFLASVLVAFFYKKGILPLLRTGLSALSESAGKTGRLTEKFAAKAEEEIAAIRASTLPVAEVLQKTEECMNEMHQTIDEVKEAWEQTRRILATETTLFYELLSSANLPQAQKDSMSDSYYRLRDELEKKQ